MKSGNKLDCNVAIWATGADPQEVSAVSDLELMNGYFRVNNFLQSTSHPNVFAGGDCITMETYAAENFPPKAGVYAVREGPVIAQNVFNFINDKPLDEYVP
jgi:selenide,water dikinase